MSLARLFTFNQLPLFLSPKLSLTAYSGFAFLIGATSPFVIRGLGQIYLIEILLLLFAYISILTTFAFRLSLRKKLLTSYYLLSFILFLFISFLGYIVSDLIVGSAPIDFLRGWAKIFFLGTNILGLSLMSFPNPWNLWWASLGSSLSSIVFLVLSGTGGITSVSWKLGYGGSVTSAIVLLLPLFGRNIVASGAIAIGLVNMLLDFRSLGAFCLLVAVIIFVKDRQFSRQSILKMLLAFGVVTLLLIYSYNQSDTFPYGSLGQTYEQRRIGSNAGRAAGIGVALQAISESPIIGYGSWAKDNRLARLHQEITFQEAREAGYIPPIGAREQTENIHAHSQLLQVWIEGGILGICFFVVFGVRLFTSIKYCCFVRSYDSLLPFFLFYLVNSAWDFFASPFAGSHRISIATSTAIVCIIYAERKVKSLKKV